MWSKGKRHDRHQAEHRELVGTGADATPASPPTLADVAAAGGSGAGELVKMDLGAAGSDGASSSGGGGAQVVDVPGDGGSSGGGGAGSNKQRRCLHRVRTKAWWQGFFDSNVYHNTGGGREAAQAAPARRTPAPTRTRVARCAGADYGAA